MVSRRYTLCRKASRYNDQREKNEKQEPDHYRVRVNSPASDTIERNFRFETPNELQPNAKPCIGLNPDNIQATTSFLIAQN